MTEHEEQIAEMFRQFNETHDQYVKNWNILAAYCHLYKRQESKYRIVRWLRRVRDKVAKVLKLKTLPRDPVWERIIRDFDFTEQPRFDEQADKFKYIVSVDPKTGDQIVYPIEKLVRVHDFKETGRFCGMFDICFARHEGNLTVSPKSGQEQSGKETA